MISPIRRHLAKRWSDGLVLEEFGVGYGVADVVAARPHAAKVAQRRRLGQLAALPRRSDVMILQALRRRPMTPACLSEATGIPERAVRGVVRYLAAENFVQKDSSGLVHLRGAYAPVLREVWAVEAKVKNWFEGVCQARRYQHFAHRVYLAILETHRRRVDVAILRSFNVGLIVVSPGTARIVLHPRRREPKSEDLFLLTNERLWDATASA
jgi:predicted transcriptional regulator